MAKLTKRQKAIAAKVEAGKAYSFEDAAKLLAELSAVKFTESFEEGMLRALETSQRWTSEGFKALAATYDGLIPSTPAAPFGDALPTPEEADADGTFAKEPFLRALVVQLARHVEHDEGPDGAAAAVAQVGADVGGRMEEEYRRARGIVGRLSPDQMADLYVRLKHAIDGDFHVIEASDERIVLGNRRCPFGDAVRAAPALCRMTSSVFGGIAARNAGGAAVLLEERIAVGDPGCRVVIRLGPQDAGEPFAHVYAAPGD